MQNSPRRPQAGGEAAARKATYAIEPNAVGTRPSRKSTRTSANRAKSDTNLVLRAAREMESPAAKFEQADAKHESSMHHGAPPPRPKYIPGVDVAIVLDEPGSDDVDPATIVRPHAG